MSLTFFCRAKFKLKKREIRPEQPRRKQPISMTNFCQSLRYVDFTVLSGQFGWTLVISDTLAPLKGSTGRKLRHRSPTKISAGTTKIGKSPENHGGVATKRGECAAGVQRRSRGISQDCCSTKGEDIDKACNTKCDCS